MEDLAVMPALKSTNVPENENGQVYIIVCKYFMYLHIILYYIILYYLKDRKIHLECMYIYIYIYITIR